MKSDLDERILEIGRRYFPSEHFVEIARQLSQESGQAYISVLEERGGFKYKKARLWRSVPSANQDGHVDWGPHGVIESPGEVDLCYLLRDCEEVSRHLYRGEPGFEAVIYRMRG